MFKITVTCAFWPEQSDIAHDSYVFVYTIKISNVGGHSAQLLSRHWVITDGDGHVQEVRGPGVVGQQPRLEPGEQYSYSSGTLMTTRVGFMQGSYQMQTDDGATFDAPIAPFRLVVPGALH